MPSLRRFLPALFAGVLIFLSLGAWSLSSPVGSSPDEDFHLASIWCGSGPREGLCETGPDARTWQVPKKALDAPCYAFDPGKNASCQGQRYMAPGDRLVESRRVNAGSEQYPSGFYFWMSPLAGDNIAVSTVLMRLANAALFSLLFVGTWILLPRRLRFTLSASIALTAVPLAMFLIPSVNPSSWSIISIAIMFPALLGFFSGRGRRAAALGAVAVLAAFLGIGARGDSAAYAGVAICAALALSFRRDRRFYIRALLPLVLVVFAALAFLGAGQTGLAMGGMGESAATTSRGALLITNLLALPALWGGIYGLNWGLGWLDTSMPALVWAATLVSVIGVCFLALRWQGWRKLVAVLGIGSAAVVVPVYILVSSNVTVGSEVQPRYVLPLLMLLVAAILAPSEDPRGRGSGVTITQTQAWTVAALLTLANSVALYNNMHRYTGLGTMRLDGSMAWWWQAGPIPLVAWLIGSVSFALVMALFARFATPTLRDFSTVGQSTPALASA